MGVPGGDPPQEYRASCWAPHRFEAGVPLEVLLVGRAAPEKGFDHVVEAAADVTGRPVRITLCGDGSEVPRLLAQAEALGVPLHLQGWTSPEGLASLARRLSELGASQDALADLSRDQVELARRWSPASACESVVNLWRACLR
ncbi:MAG: glycosyltransferase [Nocardioides sp.]